MNQIVATPGPRGTTLAVARATSPVRLVRPTFPGSRAAAVCMVTLGAGLVDGDAIELDLEVEAGAVLVAFTQASTKVFKGASSQTIRAKVAGTLVLLPDPVSCFAGSRFRQRVEVDLTTDDAKCVLMDGFTSGRPAFGERWAFSSLETRTIVRRRDHVIIDDAIVLTEDVMGRFEAFSTLLSVGALTADLLAPAVATEDLVAAPSKLSRDADAALVRIAATSPSLVIAEARGRLRNLPDIDAVDPFAARS